MSSMYPAEIYREDGSVDLLGSITFTDENNSPTTSQVIVGGFPFSYTTAGLNNGVTVYTPGVGDLILDIGICLTTAFNGTTPNLDVGTFSGGNVGLFGELAGAAVDGTKLYAAVTDNAGLTTPNTAPWLQAAVGSVGAAAGAAYKSSQILVTAANPILLVASQSGQKGGTATGATAGAGMVLVAYVTDPFTFKR